MTLKQTFIRDMTPGQRVTEVFVLAESRQGQGKNGPFWSLTLQDASGRLEAKIFSPTSRDYPELPAGRAARVAGTVQTFRDTPQLLVDRLEYLPEEALADETLMAGLIPMADPGPEELMAELEGLIRKHLHHKPWRNFCRKVLADSDIHAKFMFAPGAKAIHHAYVGGLLEHTLAVCRVCMSLCDLYPHLDRQTLLVGAVFHDLGKAWELTGGLTRDYTDEGRLLGHILIGVEKLSPFLARSKTLDEGLKAHLKHLLVSHHGEYEFGSPRRPKTAEALVLHYADNLDAKLKTVAECLGDCPEGGWSAYVRPLERFLHKPAVTPGPESTKDDGKVPGQLCLLPSKE